jgi:hypothetical protein
VAEVSTLATTTVSGWSGKGRHGGGDDDVATEGREADREGVERVENGRVWLPIGSRGVKSYIDGSAGVPVWHPVRRGQHGVAGDFIGLQNWPTTFSVRRCGPTKVPDPEIAILLRPQNYQSIHNGHGV